MLHFSMSSLFIVLSGYFINIICSSIFSVVPVTYFGYFPILIRVFCCISIFIILFYDLFIFSSIFSNLLYVLFNAFNISPINISIFLDSMLLGVITLSFTNLFQSLYSPYYFIFILSFGYKFFISLCIRFLIIIGCFSISTKFNFFYYFSCFFWI